MKTIMMWAVALLLTMPAYAAPDIKMSMTAEKEVISIEKGKKVKKRVAAKDVLPGDVIFFTLIYDNQGDEAATSVVLDNPISKGMVYKSGSAYGAGAVISFSIDSGKTYKQPSLLTYKVGGKEKKASPELYTHIRWTVKRVDALKSGSAGFRAVVQ